MRYTKDNPLRVVTLCSGYDSQCLALERIKEKNPEFDYELVGWSEIDKYAIQAHNAIFPQWADRNLGDMSKIDWSKFEGEIDLLTYSTPCQDFSLAGLRRGGQEGSGTRSSLLWFTRQAIIAKKPKFLMMENVKGLLSAATLPTFIKWEQELASYGYTNYRKVMNAKDYGVPQNRERVFCVSILNEEDAHFSFPPEIPLTRSLKDCLEKEVAEKYYLSDEQVAKFTAHCDRKQLEGCGFKFGPTDGGGQAKSITTRSGQRETDNYLTSE